MMRFALALLLAALVPLAVSAAGDLEVQVTDANGRALPDAVVYVVPDAAAAFPAPRPGLIDQVNREYVPLVSAVQVGTSVQFPNSDNIRHQVYSFSPARVFSLKLYSGKTADPVLFDKPGLVVLGCNIHDQMIAWLLVVPTPWFATTGATGRITLSSLPAGTYRLYAWHPGLTGEPAGRPLTLAASGTRRETVSVPAGPIPRPVGGQT